MSRMPWTTSVDPWYALAVCSTSVPAPTLVRPVQVLLPPVSPIAASMMSTSPALATPMAAIPSGKVDGEKPGREARVMGPAQVLSPPASCKAPVSKMPVPERVSGSSTERGGLPAGVKSWSCAPSRTTAPAVPVPRAALFCTCTAPWLTMVAPV